MAVLNISYELIADNEEIARKKALPKLKELCEKVETATKFVEQDCLTRFPSFLFEINFWLDYVDVDELEKLEEGIVWEFHCYGEAKTIDPNKEITEYQDKSFNEYDIWHKLGEPKYQDICEPLYYCDWSAVQPLCDGTIESTGCTISVEFSGIKAVDSYHGGIHFYHNPRWL